MLDPSNPLCGADAADFDRNQIAALLAIISLVITTVLYFWNSGCLIIQLISGAASKSYRERPYIPFSPLSSMLAAAIGLEFIFASWSQALEGGSLLVVVLAQVSVLGWQDHDVEVVRCLKTLLEKMIDVVAVAVAIYALDDARTRYLETHSSNTFYSTHDPVYELKCASALLVTGSILGILQRLWTWYKPQPSETSNKIFATGFFVIQSATTVAAIIAVSHTLPDSCGLNIGPKIVGIVALIVGDLYSFAVGFRPYFKSEVVSCAVCDRPRKVVRAQI